MTEWTAFLSAIGWCLFGIAAIIIAVCLLRLLSRFDRIIALAEIGAGDRLPSWMRKLIGR
jgi:hypothetical protein